MDLGDRAPFAERLETLGDAAVAEGVAVEVDDLHGCVGKDPLRDGLRALVVELAVDEPELFEHVPVALGELAADGLAAVEAQRVVREVDVVQRAERLERRGDGAPRVARDAVRREIEALDGRAHVGERGEELNDFVEGDARRAGVRVLERELADANIFEKHLGELDLVL
eukprot:Amastigsp_a510609_10.p5 type:complete len:169 gc:universal Amastigsp_a510609_10:875-1381(+)